MVSVELLLYMVLAAASFTCLTGFTYYVSTEESSKYVTNMLFVITLGWIVITLINFWRILSVIKAIG